MGDQGNAAPLRHRSDKVAVTYALVYHATTFVPITLLGVYSLVIRTGLGLKNLRQEAAHVGMMAAVPIGSSPEVSPAKVNLFLRVLAREDDGFHGIETLFCRLGLADELTVERRDGKGSHHRNNGDRTSGRTRRISRSRGSSRGSGGDRPEVWRPPRRSPSEFRSGPDWAADRAMPPLRWWPSTSSPGTRFPGTSCSSSRPGWAAMFPFFLERRYAGDRMGTWRAADAASAAARGAGAAAHSSRRGPDGGCVRWMDQARVAGGTRGGGGAGPGGAYHLGEHRPNGGQ